MAAACGCTCDCSICNPKLPPSYPITCSKCGVTYGSGGKVDNHRPGSVSCKERQKGTL